MFLSTAIQNKLNGIKVPYGSISVAGSKYFYKIVSNELAEREIRGHKALYSKYPIAVLIGGYPINNKKTVLIFDYEKTINSESGLLIDYFAHRTKIDKTIINILELYRKIFINTLRLDSGESSDIFFKSRIETRLKKYYDQNFINKMDGTKINLNGYELTLHLKIIMKSIDKYFNNHIKTWCVLSQCDPNDLNIGLKPIILDYLGGGYNPIMAEFATFYWYQMAMSNYFALRYNSKAYLKHKEIYKKIDKLLFNNNDIFHYANSSRKNFTKEYIIRVINPVMERIGNFENWYGEFKNYLAMRILCVFNVKQMPRKDMLLSLGYLQLFYDQSLNKPEELIKFFYHKQ